MSRRRRTASAMLRDLDFGGPGTDRVLTELFGRPAIGCDVCGALTAARCVCRPRPTQPRAPYTVATDEEAARFLARADGGER